MREILFRGKTEQGQWVQGDLLHPDLYGNGYSIEDFTKEKNNCFDIIPETVGQYTGLADKNGKKIFEGDIVKTDKFNEPNKQYIIKYDLQFGAFISKDKYNMYFTTFDGDSNQFEIIGNIHDNPELLAQDQ